MNRVDDIMNKNTVSLSPNMPIMDAVFLLGKYNLDGAPVIDSGNKVVGTLTQYDLSTKGTGIHLPTLFKLFEEFDLYKTNKFSAEGGLGTIFSMHVKDVMNAEPFALRRDSSIDEAARTFSEHHHVNPIPIIEEDGRLAGVLNQYDLIKYYAGGGVALFHPEESGRAVDDQVNVSVKSFENKFLFVSRFRTRFWFIFSISFLVIGFIIATAVLIRINLK